MRQGPHQGAQKSTKTGCSLFSTSAVKVASVVGVALDIRGVVEWVEPSNEVRPFLVPPTQRCRPLRGAVMSGAVMSGAVSGVGEESGEKDRKPGNAGPEGVRSVRAVAPTT
jgi:hypothetical protein